MTLNNFDRFRTVVIQNLVARLLTSRQPFTSNAYDSTHAIGEFCFGYNIFFFELLGPRIQLKIIHYIRIE